MSAGANSRPFERRAMSTATVRAELRQSIREFSERGLRSSAKWAAEQLVGLPQSDADDEMALVSDPSGADAEEPDRVLLAKAYFDANEFRRASHALTGSKSHCGRFLRWYSLYLAGEKRKDEAHTHVSHTPHSFRTVYRCCHAS